MRDPVDIMYKYTIRITADPWHPSTLLGKQPCFGVPQTFHPDDAHRPVSRPNHPEEYWQVICLGETSSRAKFPPWNGMSLGRRDRLEVPDGIRPFQRSLAVNEIIGGWWNGRGIVAFRNTTSPVARVENHERINSLRIVPRTVQQRV